MVNINDVANYKPCRQKQAEYWLCKPPKGTLIFNKLNQWYLYRSLLQTCPAVAKIFYERGFLTAAELEQIKAGNIKLYTFLTQNCVVTNDTESMVVCGTEGEFYSVSYANACTQFKMFSNGSYIPLQQAIKGRVEVYNGEQLLRWYRAINIPNNNTYFACFIPLQEIGSFQDYKGRVLEYNNAYSMVGHGKGDFIVCRGVNGVPDLVHRFVCNGLVFGEIYDNRGWVNCLSLQGTRNIEPKELWKVENKVDGGKATTEVVTAVPEYKKEVLQWLNEQEYDVLDIDITYKHTGAFSKLMPEIKGISVLEKMSANLEMWKEFYTNIQKAKKVLSICGDLACVSIFEEGTEIRMNMNIMCRPWHIEVIYGGWMDAWLEDGMLPNDIANSLWREVLLPDVESYVRSVFRIKLQKEWGVCEDELDTSWLDQSYLKEGLFSYLTKELEEVFGQNSVTTVEYTKLNMPSVKYVEDYNKCVFDVDVLDKYLRNIKRAYEEFGDKRGVHIRWEEYLDSLILSYTLLSEAIGVEYPLELSTIDERLDIAAEYISFYSLKSDSRVDIGSQKPPFNILDYECYAKAHRKALVEGIGSVGADFSPEKINTQKLCFTLYGDDNNFSVLSIDWGRKHYYTMIKECGRSEEFVQSPLLHYIMSVLHKCQKVADLCDCIGIERRRVKWLNLIHDKTLESADIPSGLAKLRSGVEVDNRMFITYFFDCMDDIVRKEIFYRKAHDIIKGSVDGTSLIIYHISKLKRCYGVIRYTTPIDYLEVPVNISKSTLELIQYERPDKVQVIKGEEVPKYKYTPVHYYQLVLRMGLIYLAYNYKKLKLLYKKYDQQVFGGLLPKDMLVSLANYTEDTIDMGTAIAWQHSPGGSRISQIVFNTQYDEFQKNTVSMHVKQTLLHEMAHGWTEAKYGTAQENEGEDGGTYMHLGEWCKEYWYCHGKHFAEGVRLAAEATGIKFEDIFGYGLSEERVKPSDRFRRTLAPHSVFHLNQYYRNVPILQGTVCKEHGAINCTCDSEKYQIDEHHFVGICKRCGKIHAYSDYTLPIERGMCLDYYDGIDKIGLVAQTTCSCGGKLSPVVRTEDWAISKLSGYLRELGVTMKFVNKVIRVCEKVKGKYEGYFYNNYGCVIDITRLKLSAVGIDITNRRSFREKYKLFVIPYCGKFKCKLYKDYDSYARGFFIKTFELQEDADIEAFLEELMVLIKKDLQKQ